MIEKCFRTCCHWPLNWKQERKQQSDLTKQKLLPGTSQGWQLLVEANKHYNHHSSFHDFHLSLHVSLTTIVNLNNLIFFRELSAQSSSCIFRTSWNSSMIFHWSAGEIPPIISQQLLGEVDGARHHLHDHCHSEADQQTSRLSLKTMISISIRT